MLRLSFQPVFTQKAGLHVRELPLRADVALIRSPVPWRWMSYEAWWVSRGSTAMRQQFWQSLSLQSKPGRLGLLCFCVMILVLYATRRALYSSWHCQQRSHRLGAKCRLADDVFWISPFQTAMAAQRAIS